MTIYIDWSIINIGVTALQIEKGGNTKGKLIATAAGLFLEKGYHATGINEILDIAGIPKGSFYFHFNSKKELASFVADYYANRVENWIRQIARDKTWVEFVNELVKGITESASCGKNKGCPLGVLGVEIAFVEPKLAQQYAAAMDKIILLFKEVLERSGVNPAESVSVARRAFALYEGYIQYYRITKQTQVFDYIRQDLLSLYGVI